MRIYFLLFWFLTITANLLASTVTVSILDPAGDGRAARVTFSPISTPTNIGTDLITTRPVTITTAADGSGSAVLKAGDYKVNIAGRDPFVISVPNDSDTYDMTALISSTLTYTFTYPAALGTATGINIINAAGDSVTGSPMNFYTYNYGISTNALISIPQITVTDIPFSATGDGATDDYAAIQGAINAAMTTNAVVINGVTNRPSVYIPSGTYYLSQSLNVNRPINVGSSRHEGLVIYGDGMFSTVLMGADTGYPVVDALGMNFFTIRDIGITSAEDTSPSVGLLLGRRDDTENAGFNSVDRVYITGDFHVAQLFAINAEVTRYSHSVFKNFGNPYDCTAFVSAISAENHTTTNVVSRYATLSSVGAGDRNTQITYDTVAFQNNDDLVNNRVIRLEKPKGHLFINCGNYAGFTTQDQALIEIVGKSEDNTFIGLRQEYEATALRGIHFIDTAAAATEDAYNISFLNCSIAPIYGEDDIRFSALQLNGVKWYTPDVADVVLDVYDLYDSTIQNAPNVFASGSKTRVDGIFRVRNNAARNDVSGVLTGQIEFLHVGGEGSYFDFHQNIQVFESYIGFSPQDTAGPVDASAGTADAYLRRFGSGRIGTETDFQIGGSLNSGAIDTIADGDTSPSVNDAWHLTTANTAPTTITAFDDPLTGQEIFIAFGDSNTTIDFSGATLSGNLNEDWNPITGDYMKAVYDGTTWHCFSPDFEIDEFEFSIGLKDIGSETVDTGAKLRRYGSHRIGSQQDWTIGGSFNANAIGTIADGDATPSWADVWMLKTANTAPTTITGFDTALTGQQMIILFNDANTTIKFTNATLIGNGNVDWTAEVGDQMIVTYDGTNWLCALSRQSKFDNPIYFKAGPVFDVKAYGAVGNGNGAGGGTNDRGAIQGALNAANSAGGGIVFLPKGVYQVDTALQIYSNTTLTGPGTIEFNLTAGESYGITALGTLGSLLLLDADTVAGATTIPLAATTGLSINDIVRITDDRASNNYGTEIRKIKTVNDGVSIVVTEPLVLPYKDDVGYAADVAEISGLENVTIDGVTFKGLDDNSSNFKYMIDVRYGRNIRIENCVFKNHVYSTLDTALITVYVANCDGVQIVNNTKYGVDSIVAMDEGDSINVFGSSKVVVRDNKLYDAAFGISMSMCVGGLVTGNTITGDVATEARGIKFQGSYYSVADNNFITGLNVGMKQQDGGHITFSNNRLMYCDAGIEFNDIQVDSDNQMVNHKITGNHLLGLGSAWENGISTDSTQCKYTLIADNHIENYNSGITSQALGAIIRGNTVLECGTSDGVGQGIFFQPNYSIVANNFVYAADATKDSFRIIGASPAYNGSVVTGNSAPNNAPFASSWFNIHQSTGNSVSGEFDGILTGSASLNFDLDPESFHDLTITVTGARVGDECYFGRGTGATTDDVIFDCWVSATDTVTVRAVRVDATVREPAATTFIVKVDRNQ